SESSGKIDARTARLVAIQKNNRGIRAFGDGLTGRNELCCQEAGEKEEETEPHQVNSMRNPPRWLPFLFAISQIILGITVEATGSIVRSFTNIHMCITALTLRKLIKIIT